MTGKPPVRAHAASADVTSGWRHDNNRPHESRALFSAFCDYLELRVATENIALLRRIARDYFAHHAQTLNEFVELSVNLVTVLSFDETDPSKRAAAAQILKQQQQTTMVRVESPRFVKMTANQSATSDVLAHIEARVATKNMPWLQRIYADFCIGRDGALVDFVSAGIEVVSVLPVALPLPPSLASQWLAYPQSLPMHVQASSPMSSLMFSGAPFYSGDSRSYVSATVTTDAHAIESRHLKSSIESTLPSQGPVTQQQQLPSQRPQSDQKKRARVSASHKVLKVTARKSKLQGVARHATHKRGAGDSSDAVVQ